MIYRRIKGTRDILPEEYFKRNYVYEVAEDLFLRFGFLPVLTPVFEQTELFVRGIGEASDIVQKEMYTFVDRGGRSLTLRPEGTAPVVRAYLENSLKELRYPLKLYYIMPMYRYERPQKGRLREFWQIGVEVFGAPGPDVDAEIIFLMVKFFESLGLKEFTTEINTIGCRSCRPAYLEKLKEYLLAFKDKLCPDCLKRYELNPLRVFDCKNENCLLVLKDAPRIYEFVCENCKNHFEGLKQYLDKFGVKYLINPDLVRGLDYYEKTTFEVKSPLLGAQSAIGGGGRYDPLIEDCGGEPTPGLGFAIGVERLLLQLEEENLLKNDYLNLDVFVLFFKGFKEKAIDIANSLRFTGIKADLDYLERSLKAQFKQADKAGAKLAIIVAPEEESLGKVKFRDMKTGSEWLVSYENLINEASEFLKKEVD